MRYIYNGSLNVASSGKACVKWRAQRLSMYYPDVSFPDPDPHNYCRNPDGNSQPWCYTETQNNYQRGPCDLPSCGECKTT